MSRSAARAAGAGLILGVALGAVATYAIVGRRGPDESAGRGRPGAATTAGSPAQVALRLRNLEAEHLELERDHEALVEEQRRDREEIARLSAGSTRRWETPEAEPPPPPAEEETDATGSREPLVAFESWGDDPALREADWEDIGGESRDVMRARGAGIGGGRPSEMAALERKALRRLREHLAEIDRKSPALSKHPVVYLNMMAAHLIHASLPLEDWQLTRIATRGEEYERLAAQQRATTTSDTPATERKLRDIELKRELVDWVVEDVLTKEQWNTLFEPATRGLVYYDVYQVGGLELERPNSSVYWRGDVTEATQHLEIFLKTEWALSAEDMERLAGLVDRWIEEATRLPPGPHHPTSALHIDEVLPSAALHVRFQEEVLSTLSLEPQARRAIVENPIFVVFPGLGG